MPQETGFHHVNPIGTDDILIAVIGSPGAGKTTFINTLTGNTTNQGRAGSGSTPRVNPIAFENPSLDGKKIIFLDTPGFDGTTCSDAEILQGLEDWLARIPRHSETIKLSGILYLTPITNVSSPAISPSNLPLLRKLCDARSLHNFVLITTMWDQLEEDAGSCNETELIENYWRSFVLGGAHVARFQGTSADGWYVVEQIVGNSFPELLFQLDLCPPPPPEDKVIVAPVTDSDEEDTDSEEEGTVSSEAGTAFSEETTLLEEEEVPAIREKASHHDDATIHPDVAETPLAMKETPSDHLTTPLDVVEAPQGTPTDVVATSRDEAQTPLDLDEKETSSDKVVAPTNEEETSPVEEKTEEIPVYSEAEPELSPSEEPVTWNEPKRPRRKAWRSWLKKVLCSGA